jgi:hypothetical protein
MSVTAAVPLILTGVEDRLQAAGSVGPVNSFVALQETLTAPVKPPDGVMVIVALLPVVAPAVGVMLPLLVSTIAVVSTAKLMT